jgi:hypothetical protein
MVIDDDDDDEDNDDITVSNSAPQGKALSVSQLPPIAMPAG